MRSIRSACKSSCAPNGHFINAQGWLAHTHRYGLAFLAAHAHAGHDHGGHDEGEGAGRQAQPPIGEAHAPEIPPEGRVDQVDAMVNKVLRGDPRLDGTITRVLRELGHDGIQVNWADGLVHYIALRCNQVKSATGNDGSFSMLKASIYE